MNPERWEQIERLYHDALGRPYGERTEFLDEACGDDRDLRQEVESLLACDERAQNFIATPPDTIAAEMLAMGAPIGRTLGHYQILSLLGKGGMGEVYRALDDRLGREVAVKLLPAAFSTDKDRLRRFEQEARAAGSLNHPNVLTIYDIGAAPIENWGENGRAPYIVSELLTGETLSERIRKEALPHRRVIDFAAQIARGLQAAHEKGIIHRDLKPENLFLTRDGRIKILDFGLAKLKPTPTVPIIDMDANASTRGLGTAPGMVMGTVGYMSPEQVRAEEVDHRSDIFAFGAILYEMLSGKRAFEGDSAVEVMNAILKEEPLEIVASGREVPASLERVVTHCLEKDPADRFQSTADVAFYLEALAGDSDAGSESRRRTATRPKSYSRIEKIGQIGLFGWIVVAALLGVATAVFILYLRSGKPSGSLPAQAIITQLTSYTGTESSGAISPDGRHFAFVSEKGGAPNIWTRQVAGGDSLQITNDEAVESGLVYAPDGETIYYVSQGSIWRIYALGGAPRKVVPGARSPSLSSDGTQLAYVKGQTGSPVTIEIANADGSSPRVLYEGFGIREARLSPDKRWIAYTEGGIFVPRPLKLIDIRRGESRTIPDSTKGSIWSLAWLADSRRLIVSRTYDSFPLVNALDLELVSIEGDESRRLTFNLNTRYSFPSLSADGRRMLVMMYQQQREIWTVPLGPDPKASALAARKLLDSNWDPVWMFVSRDGGTILFNSQATGNNNLWTMPADGSTPPRQTTTFPVSAVTHSSLSPDGARIAYASNQTGNFEIWVMNVDGSNPVQMTHDPAEEFWPIWSPDGSWLAFGSLRGGMPQLWKAPAAGGQAVRVLDSLWQRGDWVGDRHVFWGQDVINVAEASTGKVLRKIAGPWADWSSGGPLPVLSQDGRRFTGTRPDGYLKHSIWIFDTETGVGRPAVEFPGRFHLTFRVAWGKNSKSLIVNRQESISHIGLIEDFLLDAIPKPE